MIDIEEQLVYHDERISQSRPITLSTPLPNMTTPNTPLHMDVDMSTSHQRSIHFASEGDDVEMKQDEGQDQKLAGMQDTTSRGEIDDNSTAFDSSIAAIGQQDRTDASRPISRHGIKREASVEPPPPLGIPESSMKKQREETIPVTEKEAALKVHREQLKQESVQHEEARREELQRDEGQVEEGELEKEAEIESEEEEGAL